MPHWRFSEWSVECRGLIEAMLQNNISPGFHSSKRLPIGDFVNAKITKAYDYDLEAEAV